MNNNLRLKKRIAEAGYEVSFDPRRDGNCFYRAAAHQMGIGWEVAKSLAFDFLARNPTDVSTISYIIFNCRMSS